MGKLIVRSGNRRILATSVDGLRMGDVGSQTIPSTSSPIFTETFADSNFSSRGWYSIVSADRVASPAPPGMPGSLRLAWTAGQALPSSGGMRRLFTASPSVYVKFQMQLSANWVGSGQTSQPHLVMFLSDQDGAFEGPSDNFLALYMETNYQNGQRPQVKIQDNRYINAASIGYNPGENRATCGANGQQGYADNWDLFADASFSNGWYNTRNLIAAAQTAPGDVAWNTMEVEVILNTIVGGIGQLDGICRCWWNGTLLWQRTDLIMRTGTRPNIMLNQFLFTPFMGSGSPVTQTMYIGDLVVRTGR